MLAEGCCTAAAIARAQWSPGLFHRLHLAAVASFLGVQWAQGQLVLQDCMPWAHSWQHLPRGWQLQYAQAAEQMAGRETRALR